MGLSENAKKWIYTVIDGADDDVMGVCEIFDVEEDEAVKILAEVNEWLRGDPLVRR